MEEFLGKKYVLVSAENDEEYLKFIGVNYFKRKLAQNIKPITCIAKNDDGTYTLEMIFSWVTSRAVFTPGVEFDETKADDTKDIAAKYQKLSFILQAKSTITFDGNKMTHVQNENGKVSTHVREYFPDKMLSTTTAEGFDVIVKRVYELVK